MKSAVAHTVRLMLIASVAAGSTAQAYGFMMRHDYTGCNQCHVDPSGGSALTSYGRAQGEVLLRTRYGDAKKEEEDVGRVANFLFGLFELPEDLLLGGDVRGAFASGPSFISPRVFPMQADLAGAAKSGKLSVSASLGLGSQATNSAKILGDQVQLISRHHWVGYSPDEDQAILIRAGRMALPFGLRIPEHTTWVRALTRTDTNVSQQYGASVSYSGEKVRGELMGIAGNFAVSPKDFRERGYSGFLEIAPTSSFSLGVSSLITHADRDIASPEHAVWRHAHGLFARLVPVRPWMLSMEVDVTHISRETLGGDLGGVALLQSDLEPVQGLHLVATGELASTRLADGMGWGAWAGVWWFFAPHADVRVDLITRREVGAAPSVALLAQLHLFL